MGKRKAQLEQEIESALRGDSARDRTGGRARDGATSRGLFWPGGHGGGGSSRRATGVAVVLPHKKTSASCVKCGVFHSPGEHRRHGEPSTAKAKAPRGRAVRAVRGSKKKVTEAPRTDPLGIVLGAVRQMPRRARYGPEDVFIYPLWAKVKARLGMSLTEFKTWLVEQNRMQNLALTRADLVDDMDPDLVEKSEINDLGAQFHFVLDRGARDRPSGRDRESSTPRRATARVTKTTDPLTLVREAVRSIHGPGRFGDRKVFISEIYRKVGKKMAMTPDEFKRWLVARNRSSDLELARADLVSAMNPALVAASETFAVPGERFPVYHFVKDDSIR